MKKTIYFFSLLVLTSCSTPKVTNLHSTIKPIDNNGIVFTLPKTVLKVDVHVKKKQFFKGPFAEFAGKYLGLKNVIANDQAIYSIEEVKLSSFTEADSSQLYYLSYITKGVSLKFTENGNVKSVNMRSLKQNKLLLLRRFLKIFRVNIPIYSVIMPTTIYLNELTR
jgi:hypothetical protein